MPMGSEEQDDGEMLAEREAEAEGPSPAEPAPPGLERCHRPIMRPWAPQRSATVWPGPCQRPGACYKLRVSAAPQASWGASALERVPRSSAGTGRFEEPDLGMTVTSTLHPASSPSMANGASGVSGETPPSSGITQHPAGGLELGSSERAISRATVGCPWVGTWPRSGWSGSMRDNVGAVAIDGIRWSPP